MAGFSLRVRMVAVRRPAPLLATVAFALAPAIGRAATTVPTDVQMPGTQPGEVSQIQSVSKCDNCHGNFEPAGEPWYNWAGSMMAHASRDPVFWATVAVAEQDFDGAGDLCIRCHVPEGWLGGRSTPTDGSGLAEGDADGVQCDVCHRLTNPDDSEHLGVQNPPFVANDGGTPPVGYYGSGQYVISNEQNTKLGPYADAAANHGFLQSHFHRSSELCGTCHDVSNPVVGDLAHNHGAQTPLAPGSFSGVPGAAVEDKAAFNNFPYQYGVVERTFSEHQASLLSQTLVSDFATLPLELQAGAILKAKQAADLAGNGGDYADGTPRTFSCQTCHMRPTVGQGCNKNPPVRNDLPVHDLTGGNYWVPDVIQHLDGLDQILLGGGLDSDQVDAMNTGKVRAQQNLSDAASLDLAGNLLRVINLTGHKLISGYPEGRRMWLTVRWYDAGDALIEEDGEYGPLAATIDGTPTQVETLLDADEPYVRVYEAHGAMTQEWANQLLGLGVPAGVPLVFDRETGAVTETLGDLAALPPGSYLETFHFVLNNHLAKDTRIPPYGMSYDEAVERNIVPVPSDQYGDPGPGGVYDYWDEIALDPPPGADHAVIELRYQPTSWEYVQFLHLANTGQIAFLADEGSNLLDAWLATGMAAPYTMVATAWQVGAPFPCSDGLDNDGDGLVDWPDDMGCANADDESEHDAALPCDDRLDNDGDGLFDFPSDPECQDPTWPSEDVIETACSDGLDNDGDGNADYPADDGCRDALDPSELYDCADGLDNDGDGLTDFPNDPGCPSPFVQTPFSREDPRCQNGLDDDGDGLTDYPDDPGCRDATNEIEAPQCNDGVDNDGDGAIDQLDQQCAVSESWWNSEARRQGAVCGLGIELVLVTGLLTAWLGRGRRRGGRARTR
jgi:hypothetical protein